MHSRTLLVVSLGLATVSASLSRFDHNHIRTNFSYVSHSSLLVLIRLRKEVDFISPFFLVWDVMFGWCGTPTSSNFLMNPALSSWFETAFWSIFSFWAMLRRLICRTGNFNYFCLIDIFEDHPIWARSSLTESTKSKLQMIWALEYWYHKHYSQF